MERLEVTDVYQALQHAEIILGKLTLDTECSKHGNRFLFRNGKSWCSDLGDRLEISLAREDGSVSTLNIWYRRV